MNEERKWADLLILGALIVELGVMILSQLITNLIDTWHDSPFKYFVSFLYVISGAMPVVIAIAVRNTLIKVFALIIGSILLLTTMVFQIRWIFFS